MPVMLVTGASRGIGAAVAELAARHGWDVAVGYHSGRAAAEAVVERVRSLGSRGAAVGGDVAVESDVVALFDATERELGPIDALVNNAGVAPGYGPFVDLSASDIERTVAVNLTGALLCAREALRRMSTQRGGRGGSIVNVSSKAAIIGGPNEWIHYAASKGGVESLTAGLSKEAAAHGVRVNGVRPGLIDGGFGPWDPPGRIERMMPNVPMGRAGTATEVAEAVVWLASPAASYVTGSTIDVTGGR